MQIVIPMSGFGERFRAAGYKIPKPLIVVENKPIIKHVVELFPGDHDFIFVCNSDHLDNLEFGMQKTIEGLGVKHKIVAIPPHKKGPVHAILQARGYLKPDEQVIVNYADFTCRWDFQDFSDFVSETKPSGVVPAYKGFHPHSGGTTNYAYISESEGNLISIREKQPFTDDKVQEYASTGTYYFESARLMIDYFEKQVQQENSVNGEFYVSSAFDLMAKDRRQVTVYKVEHFMQWGTPADLMEYNFWSEKFHELVNFTSRPLPIKGLGQCLILASGSGSRFFSEGYKLPKQLLRASGTTILNQVSKVASRYKKPMIIALKGSGISDYVCAQTQDIGECYEIENISKGQADSARILVKHVPKSWVGPISILPSDTLFADDSDYLDELLCPENGECIVVWVSKPSQFQLNNPSSFGWIGFEGSQLWSSIKRPPTGDTPMLISGAFSFSSISTFESLIKRLDEMNLTINGEQYLDSLVDLAKELGITVKVFQPSFTLSLGTPYEFETFRYWQTCFDRWFGHPYSINHDPFVDPSSVERLRLELASTRHDPSEWKN